MTSRNVFHVLSVLHYEQDN